MKKLVPLIVNRKKWVRGGYNGEASLLNNDGNMCCLGFACRALGVSAKMIEGQGFPADLDGHSANPERLGKKLGKLVEVVTDKFSRDDTVAFQNTEDVEAAQLLNDNEDISDKMREYRLKPILKKLGFAAKFTGPTRD